MHDPLTNNQDLSHNDINSKEIASKLVISVDNAGSISYNCDWEPTEEGLIGVASILYKLLLDDLAIKIFEEIKSQCVLNNTETDFAAIESMMQQYSILNHKDSEEVVVPPDKMVNL